MKKLFENEFCIIWDNFGLWIRVDKVTMTTMHVTSYINKNGKQVKQIK